MFDQVLFGLETNNEAWPVPKLNRPVTDKELRLLDCFGVVGANQGLEAYKAGRQDQRRKLGSLPSIASGAKNSISGARVSGPYTSEQTEFQNQKGPNHPVKLFTFRP